MKVPEDSIRKFNKEGYLPVENILSMSEVKEIRKRLEEIAKGETDFPKKHIQIEPKLEGKNHINDISAVRKISHLTKYDSIFIQLARNPEILAYVKAIIGPDLKVYLDQTMCKQAHIGSAKPPHQDSAYWTDVEPKNQIICWIAINDSTIENGCMRYIPGSHKGD
jgi:ectoine hydroxylase-related dioxygenase (phytanoyl-CoA dioxygenase family)